MSRSAPLVSNDEAMRLIAPWGFLVLHAEEVLRAPFAWDALKGALTSREIRIENLASQYSAVPTVTLRPQPIPLEVKVVIIGTPQLYHLLSAVDDDFRELFKVRVDFAPDMDWTEETSAGYARLISRLVRDHCDLLISLPMRGHVGSLNAAIAGSVALYEIWRQRGWVMPTLPADLAED